MNIHATVQKSPGDPRTEVAELAARCMHCGLCNAVCPTYLVARDERDGPRGRIALIAEMFARGRGANPAVRRHIDRCLSCRACESACPADVAYRRIVDHARSHIQRTTRATLADRLHHWVLARVLPEPRKLRWLVRLLPAAVSIARHLRRVGLRDWAALAETAPPLSVARGAFAGPGRAATTRQRRARVILHTGCAQMVLRPQINDATIRLLARRGCDVIVAAGAGCCGAALVDIGDAERARALARANIDAWSKEIAREPVDAIISNAAGCGAAVKDYGYLLADDPNYAESAGRIASLGRDVCEFVDQLGIGPPWRWSSLKVAYQSSCGLRHGQGVHDLPLGQLHAAGFTAVEVAEADICCGAARSFRNPATADALRLRKARQIRLVKPDIVATGSLTCLKHLEAATLVPVVHTVELLDWAYGGPTPAGLEHLGQYINDVPGLSKLDVEDYIRAD